MTDLCWLDAAVTTGPIEGSRKVYRECGPKFCSIRIIQDIRDAMAEKSRDFSEHGNRV